VEVKNLYQRIAGIMADLGAVGKGGQTNYGERYKYHRIDDIDDKLREALITNGVVATVSSIDNRVLEHFEETDRQGKPRTTWYAECTLQIELVNVDKPDERLIIHGWGQGIDYSDKATGKAISYAAKAAYLSAFHLRGQPDSEQDDIKRQEAALDKRDRVYVTDALKQIAECKSLEDLAQLGEIFKDKSPAIQAALRTGYIARQRQLKENSSAAGNSQL